MSGVGVGLCAGAVIHVGFVLAVVLCTVLGLVLGIASCFSFRYGVEFGFRCVFFVWRTSGEKRCTVFYCSAVAGPSNKIVSVRLRKLNILSPIYFT